MIENEKLAPMVREIKLDKKYVIAFSDVL